MSDHRALTIRADAEQSADLISLTLTVDLPPEVHLEPHQPSEPYLIPTVLDVDGLRDVKVDYPTPTVKDLGWQDITLTVLEGTLQFGVTGRASAGLERISGTLHYQPCVGGACLPPRTIRWHSPVSGTTAYSVLNALAA
ncbi:MAG TPA: protein-disulfide reductase DsbD domain-containing protein [Jiangellaceae bacterium]